MTPIVRLASVLATRPVSFAVLTSLTLLAGTGCATAPGNSADARRPISVLLISIDGLRPEFYQSGKGWEAPHLQALAARGATAESAEPIYPSLTYPSHTTIVTGVRSARHGVVSNTMFTLAEGPLSTWYWDAANVQAPTLWARAKAAGLHTAILTWPATVGATADWVIPEIFASPPATAGTSWELMQKHMTPSFARELREAISLDPPDGFGPRDAWVAEAAYHVLHEHHPDFTLIHIINVDHAEHEWGKDSAPAHAALTVADAQLGRILSATDPARTIVLVLGDHGFYDYDHVIRPNALFAQQGWLNPENPQQWQVIAHGEGGAATVYARDARVGTRAVRLLKQRAHGAYRVLERAELDRLAAFPGALCAIEPVTHGAHGTPGYGVSTDTRGAFIEKLPAIRGNHGPLPTDDPGLLTGLVAAGPGIARGTALGRLKLLDVAPTVARLLDIPLSDAEGTPIEALDVPTPTSAPRAR